MDTPQSGPDLVLAALRELGQAGPSAIADWHRDTFGTEPPVKDTTIRYTVARMAKEGRIYQVRDAHGVYTLEPPRRTLAEWDAENPGAQARPVAPGDMAILYTLDGPEGPVLGYDMNAGRFVKLGEAPGVSIAPAPVGG